MPQNNELTGEAIFTTITLDSGKEVRAVMVTETGLDAMRIMPKAAPYVKQAHSLILPNNDGKNTATILSAIPLFLSGTDVEWVSTVGTTYVEQSINSDGQLVETIRQVPTPTEEDIGYRVNEIEACFWCAHVYEDGDFCRKHMRPISDFGVCKDFESWRDEEEEESR